ncbi:MAG TPA: hypothetical protein VGQ83_30480 [Polyangia bacterium]|jgi:hypothetical protein
MAKPRSPSATSAVAVSREDFGEIETLMRELGAKSKAQVVRLALQALRAQLARERLGVEIRSSVLRCAVADREENEQLTAGAAARDE